MALPKYTHSFILRSNSYKAKTYDASVFQNNVEFDVLSNAGSIDIVTGVRASGTNYPWRPNAIPYHLSGLKINAGNMFAKQLGDIGIGVFANTLMDDIESVINEGRTGQFVSGDWRGMFKDGKYVNKNRMPIKVNDNTYWGGYFQINIIYNQLNPDNIYRSVEISIFFNDAQYAYNGDTVTQSNSGNSFHTVNTTSRVLFSPQIKQAFVDGIMMLQNINLYPMVTTTLQYVSGTYYRYKFTTRYPNYMSRVTEYVNYPPAIEKQNATRLFRSDSGFNVGSWTSSGEVDPDDPYHEDDPNDDDVPPDDPPGPGDHDDDDDPRPVPVIPPIDGASAGLYRVFKPTQAQLMQLGNKLWDPDVWSAIKQMFTNPMEAILGLAIVPLDPEAPTTESIYLGHYNTEISAPRILNDYVVLDCGSMPITNYYGSYLDYDPYTTYTLNLPYIGEIELSADEITGMNLGLYYHCNVVTGDCVALITTNGNIIATMAGNIIRQLPLSQTDYTSIIQTAVSAVSTLLTASVGAAGASQVAGALSASASEAAQLTASNRVSSAVVNGGTSLLTDVMSAKYHYKHSGSIGNGAAQLSNQIPFLTIIRPNLALPENNDNSQQSNLKAYTGYPSNRIISLASCHGFTQIEAAKLSVPSATDEEIAEIYSLLKGGVLL